MLDLRIISASIAAPFGKAYEFARQPANFACWAAGLAQTLHETEHGWVAETPEGEAAVRFSARNDYGVLDHWVQIAGRPEIHIPLRMIANGDGTTVELVLFRQPGMSDADFDHDADMVAADLRTLKALLEAM